MVCSASLGTSRREGRQAKLDDEEHNDPVAERPSVCSDGRLLAMRGNSKHL
jgi:hypothetical protein